jgi:hypothetical protein
VLRISGSKREEVTEEQKNYTLKGFIICTLLLILLERLNLGGGCICSENENCIKSFNWKTSLEKQE